VARALAGLTAAAAPKPPARAPVALRFCALRSPSPPYLTRSLSAPVLLVCACVHVARDACTCLPGSHQSAHAPCRPSAPADAWDSVEAESLRADQTRTLVQIGAFGTPRAAAVAAAATIQTSARSLVPRVRHGRQPSRSHDAYPRPASRSTPRVRHGSHLRPHPRSGTKSRQKRRLDDVELDRGHMKKVKNKAQPSKSPYAQVARIGATGKW
jgi:hypothetical protein